MNSMISKAWASAACTWLALGGFFDLTVAATEDDAHQGTWYLNQDMVAQVSLARHHLTLTLSNQSARVAYVRSTLFDATCLRDNILSIRFSDQSILGGLSSQYKLFSNGILGMGSNSYPVEWLALQPKEARTVIETFVLWLVFALPWTRRLTVVVLAANAVTVTMAWLTLLVVHPQ